MPRKSFDGAQLAADIARQDGEDQAAPPQARPSLMDAVRGFATHIERRSRLGWTDSAIAAYLTAAGYAIDAGTLRSYRKRLRDEGLISPLPARETKAKAPTASGIRPPQREPEVPTPASDDRASASPISIAIDAAPSAGPLAEIEVDAVPRPPPPTPSATSSPAPPTSGRTFRVNRTHLPPDRA